MKAKVAASLLTLVFALLVVGPSLPASADVGDCQEIVNIYSVAVVCEYDGSSLQAAQQAAPEAKWVVYQLCKDGTSGGPEACSNPRACTIAGRIGTLYAVFRDGARQGIACLTAGEAGEVGDPPIRVLVLKAFEKLDWSESTLVVQPPGGRTLVNLETNFYTDNSGFTVIPVTLVQSEVRVQAEPISYTWHFGDGTSETTTSPGAPYPDLDVAHVYESADAVVVRVDTTYGNASFSVEGGPWETIPSTITIPGAESDLEVVEARPQLVIR